MLGLRGILCQRVYTNGTSWKKVREKNHFESKSNNSYNVSSVFSDQRGVNKLLTRSKQMLAFLKTHATCLCFKCQIKATSTNEFSA